MAQIEKRPFKYWRELKKWVLCSYLWTKLFAYDLMLWENVSNPICIFQVSLDSRVREVINRNMVDPTPHTFDEAQLQIYTLMHRDSYPRFINSAQYKTLAQLTNNGNTGGSGSGSGTPGGSGRKESNA